MKKGAVIFDFNRTLFDPTIYALYQGVKPMLDELQKKYEIILFSRKSWDRHLLLDQLGISDYFNATYFVEKKSVENLKEILDKHDLDPKECIMVGDMLTDEICVGNELGMKTIWFQQSRFGSIVGPDIGCAPNHTVNSIQALREVFQTL